MENPAQVRRRVRRELKNPEGGSPDDPEPRHAAAVARAAGGARRRLLRAPSERPDRASSARSPTPSTRSSSPTSAWRASSSASARWSARKARRATASRVDRRSGAWGAMESSVNTLIDDLLWPTAEVTRTIAAVAKGDLTQTMRLEVDGRPLEGRVPALGDHRQHDDRAAERVHLRSDARGARGRHRRQARRPGAGARRRRHLEGPDRQRELDGRAT